MKRFFSTALLMGVITALAGQSGRFGTVALGETNKPVKGIKINQINGDQVRRPPIRFAEVEIVLSERLSLADISGLQRAPRSDLEVLDGGRRVKVQLPASVVKALIEEGAEISVIRNFILFEGGAAGGGSENSDMTTRYISATGSIEGSNSNNYSITDNTPGYVTAKSPIDISGAPAGEMVTSVDVDWEIWHQCPADVVAALMNETSELQYVLWYRNYEAPGSFGETVYSISAFNNHAVNQEWQMWAGDWAYGDTGYINHWWIKVYYGEPGPPPPPYCISSGGCREYISNVNVGTINNETDCNGYADYTSLSTMMEIETSNPITVTNGEPYSGDQCGIWVDWNHDEDFDDTGETISVSGGPGTFTASITPPTNAVLGNTRMRIRIMNVGTLGPCGETAYGEVEDYTIIVLGKYCSASGGCTGSGGTLNIDSVQVGSIDNTGTGCSGYADYTSLSTTMEIGTGYPITVTNGDPYDEDDECGIWVDWNQDHDFSDSGEKIAVSGVSEIFWATITPPAAAVLGDTRMRVRIWWGGTIGPCDDSYYGEVEDYTITVTSVPSFVTISGNVETGGGVGIEDVVITASSGESDTTDASGYYELSVESPWSGTVTPSKSDWSFSPPSRSYSGITTDQPDQNYTGTYISPTITISGYVWTTGIYGLKDVLISASTGESTTTDIYGYYELTLSNPWTGSITPSKSTWTFNPPVKSYVNVGSDMTYVNFGAIAPAIPYHGGSGTAGDPYRIYSAEELQELGSNPADWDKHFKLVQHISLFGYTGEQFNMIGLFSWTGLSIPFTGVFDGEGYTISRFNYTHSSTKQEFIGIFSYINHAAAEVKNLTVARFEVDGGANGVAEGALVGLLENGTISNCSVERGSVIGQHFHSGGLIGRVWGGSITDCYICSVEVSNPDGVAGGLVGDNQGIISDCVAECDVTGQYGVGGLVGKNQSSGVIELCYSCSNSTGDQQVGGLVGENRGIISQSHSSGSVGVRGTFQSDIGGLVGRNIDGEIYNCYSTAAVIGGNDCGGLVGLNWRTDAPTIISHCYSTGHVSGTASLGGLVGKNIDGTVTNSFWDTQTSGRFSSAGGTGKTTAQMQDMNTFLDAGWDFVEETVNGTEDVWKLYHTESYPLLAWERYSGGSGFPSDPYLIYTAEEMQAIGAHPKDWNKCFKLMADIDMSGYTGTEFNLIGHYAGLSGPDNEPFEGIFDGDGHTISNFTYTSSGINCIGLFSYVSGIYAEIRDLTLTGVDISAGSGDFIGALVGRFGGVIANCSADGVISGDKYVGGLVGTTWWGMFYDCYATGSVTGNENVGGLVGDSYIGELFNCYATASVTGGIRVGGLVGDSGSGLFSTCYAAGVVSGTSELGGFTGYDDDGIYTSCLWDSEVNPDVNGIGNTTEPNVIGETTANMQTLSTFTNAGWDFVGEMSNGPDDDWGMPDGGGYPVVWWQLPSLPALPQLFSGGTGLPGEPYLVSTAGELNSIGHNPQLMDKHFRLIRDIDLAGEDFFMIGGHTCGFAGLFEGDGHVISNFTLEPAPFGQWLGLFGVVGLGGHIENLGLVDANVGSDHMLSNCIGGLVASNFGTISNCFVAGGDASGYYVVGAIAGRNSGTISDSYSAASVYGTNLVGGLSGLNHWGSIVNCVSTGAVTSDPNFSSCIGGMVGTNLGGTINTSCATGSVSGHRFIGGLVGENIGDISNSYATGDVLANSYGGGLLGYNYGYIYPASISNCYSAGLVSGDSRMGGIVGAHLFGTYTSCFWDTDINPDVNGFGNAYDDPNVTGKTTAEMQTQSTFTDAGWDFTTPVWSILEGIDYPRLAAVSLLLVDLDIDELWMYQNLSGQTKSNLTASVSITDDPAGNSSYSYDWEIILPGDVSLAPVTVAGGGSGDAFWTFAARSCDEPAGLSDSGQTFKVRVTVTGDDYGNTGIAEAEFAIALLGDVNNDRAVDIIDRTITNAFMRAGSAGAFTLKDCDVNCDGGVDIIDRTIVNAVMRGQLGNNSVSSPCPLR
ncbi:MAG: hypothetical protein AMJ43_07595 [Coxiella sp. DG_40]|nr:MAG: hypothetical protein AMJ43_07595 [Coxiella sp. DG_40]